MATDSIEIQASEWLARLDAAGPSPELLDAIQSWRASDPEHDAAFLRLQAVWQRLNQLEAMRPVTTQGVDTGTHTSFRGSAGRTVAEREPLRRRIEFARWARVYGVAASVLVICASILLMTDERVERYATPIGGFERVVLADGSIVEVNTDSEIRVSLQDKIRSVELVRGEAHFTVARDSARPFVVTAGRAAVRAVGTQFNVYKHGEQDIDVLVTEGKVALASSGAKSAAPLVTAGQLGSIVHGGEAVVKDLPPVEMNRELAWKEGMLVFAGEPLRDAIAELNRYNARQLEIDDPTIGALKIGGYFNARNLDGFVAVLESNFGVEALEAGDRIELRRAPAN